MDADDGDIVDVVVALRYDGRIVVILNARFSFYRVGIN